MSLKKSLPIFLMVFLIATGIRAADTFEIDPVHSHVGFSVRHMVVANVKGNFGEFSGTILYDSTDMAKSAVAVVIKTASINTGNTNRDDHLRNPDFFEVEKYPEITFKSSKVDKKGDGYLATGNLTMHGVTKEVAIPFEILGLMKDPYGNYRMGVEGTLTINRQDFGLAWSKAMETGGLVVGNDVKIELSIEAVKK